MNKVLLEFILVIFLVIILIFPSALFIDVIGHEFYHFYEHKQYAEQICLNVNELRAYTVVNFPDKTTKLGYNEDKQNDEEKSANIFGKIIAFVYSLIALLIIGVIIHLNIK